jgi:hypothetical protein
LNIRLSLTLGTKLSRVTHELLLLLWIRCWIDDCDHWLLSIRLMRLSIHVSLVLLRMRCIHVLELLLLIINKGLLNWNWYLRLCTNYLLLRIAERMLNWWYCRSPSLASDILNMHEVTFLLLA